MPEVPEPLIRVEALSHRFPDGALGLYRVALEVAEGEFLVLAGKNGSGKSLLARHIVGLSDPSSGKVLVRGVEVARDPRRARAAVGLVLQDSEAQIVGQSLLEDLAFGPLNLGASPVEARARAEAALEAAGLGGMGARRPDSLSGGERRRLAIAGMLALKPACLVLDEPFANLDWPSIRDLVRLLVGLKEEGTALLVITHELEKVLAHADRLAVMDSGRLAWLGRPADFPREDYSRHGLMDPYRSPRSVEELTWLA